MSSEILNSDGLSRSIKKEEVFLQESFQEVPSCARCDLLDKLSPYCLRQDEYITYGDLSTAFISSNPLLNTTHLYVCFERNYDEDYEMGPISQFLESLILYSMSTKSMKTDAQKSIESIGGTVKCKVDRFKISFAYSFPLNKTENQQMLNLCKEDLLLRIGSPSMLTKKPEDFIPYIKSELLRSKDIWHHLLFSKLLAKEKDNLNFEYLSFPSMERSALVNKMNSIDFGEESVKVASKMNSWRLFIALQSKLPKEDLFKNFELSFNNFLSQRETKDNFTDSQFYFKPSKTKFYRIKTSVPCQYAVMISYFIPMNRQKCNTSSHLIYEAIFATSNLKKVLINYGYYDFKIYARNYVSIKNVLHRMITLEVNSLSENSASLSFSSVITGYLNSLKSNSEAIKELVAIYHQKLCEKKFNSTQLDLEEVAIQMLACRMPSSPDHTYEQHLSFLYDIENLNESIEYVEFVLNFLLKSNFFQCYIDNVSSGCNDCDDFIIFDKYTESYITSKHLEIMKFDSSMLKWNFTAFPKFMYTNYHPKIEDGFPHISCVYSSEFLSLNQITNNIYSPLNYITFKISPHENLTMNERFAPICFSLVSFAIEIASELDFNNCATIGAHSVRSVGDIEISFTFQSESKLDVAFIILMFKSIYQAMLHLNNTPKFLDRVIKRTVDEYRINQNYPAGNISKIAYSFFSTLDLNIEISIEFLKSLILSPGEFLIFSSAFLSTCSLDITLSTQSSLSPISEALKQKILELVGKLNEGRGYEKNVKILNSFNFFDKFFQFRKMDFDHNLIQEKMQKHFAIISSENVRTVINIVPFCSTYSIAPFFEISLDCDDDDDDYVVFSSGAVIEFDIKEKLLVHLKNLSDKPADLNIINVKIELFGLEKLILSVNVEFLGKEFVKLAQYLLIKIGFFLSQYKVEEIEYDKIILLIKNKLLVDSSLNLDMQKINYICSNWSKLKRKESDSRKIFWHVSLRNKGLESTLETLQSKKDDIFHFSKKLFENMSLSVVYQQRPVFNPDKLAAPMNKSSKNVSCYDDEETMVQERSFFKEFMPIVAIKTENEISYKQYFELMQPSIKI